MPGSSRQPPPRHKFRPPPISTSFILPSAKKLSSSPPITMQQIQNTTDDDDDDDAFSMPNNFVTRVSDSPNNSRPRRLSLIPASPHHSDSDTENPHPTLSSHRDLPVRIPGFTARPVNVDSVITVIPPSADLDLSDLPRFPQSSQSVSRPGGYDTGVDANTALRHSPSHYRSSVSPDKSRSLSPGVWGPVQPRRVRRGRRRLSQGVSRQSSEARMSVGEGKREKKRRGRRMEDAEEERADEEEEAHEEEEAREDDDGDRDADGEGDEQHEDKEEGNMTEGDGDKMESDDEPYAEKFRRRRDERMTPSQRWCFYFFEEPRGHAAKLFAIISSFFIIVSVVMVCVESLPQFQDPSWDNMWLPIECIVNGVFTIEYLGRLYASTRKLRFVVGFMNIVDLVSVLPFYISFIFPSQAQYAFRFIRVLRLFRIVKIFQFSKYSVGLRITARVFRGSVDQIIMVSTYILVIVLLSSALIYYIERGNWDDTTHTWMRYNPNTGEFEPSPFQSIAHGFYWSIVTLTTTGYGDEVPYTFWGRVVAGFTMLCGILAVALPTSIIGSNFMNEWQEHRRLQFQARLRKNQKRVAAEDGTLGHLMLMSGPDGKLLRERHLRQRNEQMLEALVEVQEKLSEINPPRYYRKYCDIKAELQDALARISELELECMRLRKVNVNLTKFNSMFKKTQVDSGIAPGPGGADDDLYLTTDGNTTDVDLLSANSGLTLTGRAREKSVAVLNTLFRRATNGGGSGFATPGSPPPGANNSANESASNTLTSAFIRTFTEPGRGGSGRITPEVESEGGYGDRLQPMRRPSFVPHRRDWSSNNPSVITFKSVEERDALPSRSGATSPFGSPPLTPRLTLQHVTASLHRMSTPAWRRASTQGSGASGGGWSKMEEDGRKKRKGKSYAGPIKKEMIGEPTHLRRAYTPHTTDVVGTSTHRKSAEEENPLSTRTVPATNREMKSVLGDGYGLWLAERVAKMAAGGSVQQDSGDEGRNATVEKMEAGSAEKKKLPGFKRAGESLLTLFEPVLPVGGRAGDNQEVKDQSQEMIEIVVHPLNDGRMETLHNNEGGALHGGERPNDRENMTEYFSSSVQSTPSAQLHNPPLTHSHIRRSATDPVPHVALSQDDGFRQAVLQRWNQNLELISEGGHHHESNDGGGDAHDQHGGGTGGDLGTVWLGVGGELEVRQEDGTGSQDDGSQ